MIKLSFCLLCLSMICLPLKVFSLGVTKRLTPHEECQQIFFNNLTKNNVSYSFKDILTTHSALSEDCKKLFKDDPTFKLFLSTEADKIPKEIELGDLYLQRDLETFFSDFMQTEIPPSVVTALQSNIKKVQASCTPVDHRSTLPPVRNQDRVGWCYAYTAADLVSQRVGKSISAVDMALGYNFNKNLDTIGKGLRGIVSRSDQDNRLRVNFSTMRTALRNLDDLTVKKRNCPPDKTSCFNEGGWPAQAIEARQRIGFCLEKDLPSDSYEVTTLGEILKTADRLDDWTGSYNKEESQEMADFICSSNLGKILTSGFPHLLISDVADILTNVTNNSVYDHFARKACEGRRINLDEVPVDKEKSEFEGRYGSLDKVDDLLNSGKIVGFGYNTQLLGFSAADSGWHASTLVGRRWNPDSNSCEYLIRNSWGERCLSVYSSASLECDKGNIWVDRKNLVKNLIGIQYMD